MAESDKLATLAAAESGATGDASVRRLREMTQALAAFSPAGRSVCPSHEILAACHAGELAGHDAEQVRRHTAVCPFCASDFADLEALAAPPLLELVVKLAHGGIRLISHSFVTDAHAQPARVRGGAGKSGISVAAPLDELEVRLRLDASIAGTADVKLQLAGAEPPTRINLCRGEALLESRLAAGGEEPVFSEVPPGDYTVWITPLSTGEPSRVELRIEAEQAA